MDATEMENWKVSLNLPHLDFPRINSLKGMIGHPLAAAGSIELVASILQIHHNFIFGNLNLKELHLEIANQFSNDIFPKESHPFTIQHLIKASFGFGDVNAAVVLKKYKK
jgi:3-oxoacyl-(acyl-carrier-protein) synthase